MARQRVHNRRAGRGASASGASWISYSDMMAALVLVFVLFLTYNLYQYNTVLEQKTQELDEQRALVDAQQLRLDEQEGILIIQQNELKTKTDALAIAQDDLAKAQEDLRQQTIILIGQQEELEDAKVTLAAKETELANLQLQLSSQQTALDAATELLEAQQTAFHQQADKLDNIVGVRTEIIQQLSTALSLNNISATVDPTNGDIVLESTVFFDTNRSTIKAEGKTLLDNFLPVYLNVLLQPEYSEYLGEIIIEGHTDSSGSYLRNLELSQDRALAVAKYCLSMPGLGNEKQQLLQSILTAKGRSSSDLVYNMDGSENKDASRRVEFKFSLKDAEMVDEMRRILRMDDANNLQQ